MSFRSILAAVATATVPVLVLPASPQGHAGPTPKVATAVAEQFPVRVQPGSDARRPAVAFDTTRHRMLVVYDRATSGSTRVIAGVALNAAGQPLGAEVLLTPGTSDDRCPRLAYNRLTDEYLLVWRRWANNSLSIMAQRVSASVLVPAGSALVLGSRPGSLEDDGGTFVASNDDAATTDRWLVGWWEFFARLDDAAAVLTGSEFQQGAPHTSTVRADDGKYYFAFEHFSPWAQVVGEYMICEARWTTLLASVGQAGDVSVVAEPWSYVYRDECYVLPPPFPAHANPGFELAFSRFGQRVFLVGASARSYLPQEGRLLDPTVSSPAESERFKTAADALSGWFVVSDREPSTGTFDLRLAPVLGDGNAATPVTLHASGPGALMAPGEFGVPPQSDPYYGGTVAAWSQQASDTEFDIMAARVSSSSYPVRPAHGDYDGDGRADLAVVRPSADGVLAWYVSLSSGGARVQRWGEVGDVPVPGDYDGDGATDFAAWRPSNGRWYVASSSHGAYSASWGSGADLDLPVPADYDGDGLTDLAVYRPGVGTRPGVFFVVPSSTRIARSIAWGSAGDVPVSADYDGDGRADFGVWRPSTGAFFIVRSSTGVAYAVRWGQFGDLPVTGDFDGDGRADVGIWRPAEAGGAWYVIDSSTGLARGVRWGALGDIAMPADYDGDGRTEVAVWRPGTPASTFFITGAGGSSARAWGRAFDLPAAR